MESAKKETGVVFIDKNSLYFYSPTNTLGFAFSADAVKDFDLLSREKLSEEIKTFIEQNKISPVDLILIVSENASFIKDLVTESDHSGALESTQKENQKENVEQEIQNFTDNVPLENICVKIFKFDKATRVTVVNRDLLEAIKDTLEKYNFRILFAIPAFSLIRLNIQPNIGFTNDTAKTVIQKSDSVKQDDLFGEENKEEIKTKNILDKKQPIPRRTVFLIAALIFLFSIFLILFVRTMLVA